MGIHRTGGEGEGWLERFFAAFETVEDTRTGATKAGRHFLSHAVGNAERDASDFFKLSKLRDDEAARRAVEAVQEILTSKGVCSTEKTVGGRATVTVRRPDGVGFRFFKDTGEFRGWLDPKNKLKPPK